MWKLVLVVGAVIAIGVGVKTGYDGLLNTDDLGRVPMPGKATLEFEPGSYSIYYEESERTESDEAPFEPPEGIRVRVRGLEGAPDPELEFGGAGGQVGTDTTTAESFGKLRIESAGRYRVVVAPPPSPAAEPTVTFGESASASIARGARKAGYIAAIAAGIALFLLLLRLARRRAFDAVTS